MAFWQAFWVLVIELTSIFKPCWTIRALIWLFSFMNSHEMSIEFSFRAESCWTKRASKWFFINFENCLCTKDFETYGTFKFTFLLMNTQNMVLDNKFCSKIRHACLSNQLNDLVRMPLSLSLLLCIFHIKIKSGIFPELLSLIHRAV